MKKLIWKELTEQRWTPVFLALLYAMLFAFWSVETLGARGGTLASAWVVPLGFVAVGIVVGSSTLAGEAGRGTMSFLSTLPLSRATVWYAKLSGALITVFISLTGMTALSLIFLLLVRDRWSSTFGVSDLAFDIVCPEWWMDMVVFALFGLGVAMAVSTLVDRTLTALILAVTGAAGFCAVALNLVWTGYVGGVFYWSMAFAAMVFLASSFVSFCRDIRTARQVLLLAWVLSVGLILAIGFGVSLIVQAASSPRLQSPAEMDSYSPGENLSHEWHAAGAFTRPTWVYTFKHAVIGETYFQSTGASNSGNIPCRTQDVGGSVHSELTVQSDIVDMFPVVRFTYTPQGAPGVDHQEIRVFDKQGAEIEDIEIKAEKSL